MRMNWQQKLSAVQALCGTFNVAVRMRNPGDWYVNDCTEIKDGSILRGEYGNGATPEQAVEDHWDILTNLPHEQYIVVRAAREDRRAVRWNGFMWEDVAEKRDGE